MKAFPKYIQITKNKFELKNTINCEKTTQSKGYETMNIFELIEAYKEPPNPIIEHLVYEGGVTLVSGTDGVGKTWFAIQMGLAIAKGESFLDFNVAQKKVLMIQFELSPDELSDRLSNYNLDGLSKTDNLNILVKSLSFGKYVSPISGHEL